MPTPTMVGTSMVFSQPEFEYRRAEGYSQSELKEALRSPSHWLARYGPNAEPFYPTPAMKLGTAAHVSLLQPSLFGDLYVEKDATPAGPRVADLKAIIRERGLACPAGAKKAELEAIVYPDGPPVDKRTQLNREDWASVCGMHSALANHSVARQWFDIDREDYEKANEVSLYVDANCHPEGVAVKGRIDRLEKTENGWLILDIKTTDNARANEFQRKAFNMGYFIQAAFYTDLLAMVTGCDPDNITFMFCAVEKKAPYGVGLFWADSDSIQWGREQYIKALRTLKVCHELGEYFGYSSQPESLGLPSWVKMGQFDEEVGF